MAGYAWENGNIKLVNESGNEIDGQQTLSLYDDMSVDISNHEEYGQIVEENGTENTALELIKGGRFNAKLFHEQYEDRTEEVLQALLCLQSNDDPLKKGGDSIAFRCNSIINQNRQNYTVPENTLLDIITARMSSRPEDKYYIITAKEMCDILPYADKTYIYKIMKNGAKKLNRNPFIFEIQLDNGKKKNLELQWNEVMMYNGEDSLDYDEDAYISFTPTRFFRILTASSGIMHGAHYQVEVAAQISSKHARNLFYFLSSMKNYRAYPGATPGVFILPLEKLQRLVNYPATYRPADVKRSVLEVAKNEINKSDGNDFVFEYEMLKTSVGGKKKQYSHVEFRIVQIIETAEKNSKPELPIVDDSAPLQVLQGIGLTDSECKDVLKKYKENNRDLVFLTRAITSVLTATNIKSKCAVLCHIMANGLNENLSSEANLKRENSKEKKNKFNNFHQREYDPDEYEKLILTASLK